MASMDVYAICDAVEKAFSFLTQYGYSFFWANDLPIFLFKGEADDVQIAVNTYEGQVDCELLYSGEKIRFTRISEKAGLSGLRFSWQFHDFDSLEKGLPVLAESLQELIRAYDYSKEENVEALYEEAKKARDPATVQMGVDVRQADTFWQSHDYQKVRDLLKKWEGSLPEREEKRLKFAEGKAGADSGKYGYLLMEKSLENRVWGTIENVYKFVPNCTAVPYEWIRLPSPSRVYQLDFSATGEHWNRIVNSLFIQLGCTELYAMDWQHDCFVFSPQDYWKIVKEYHDEERDCHVYFPEYYPDGDYHIFIDTKGKFGLFGHPWLKQIAVFGEELIGRIDKHAEALGLSPVSDAERPEMTNEMRAEALAGELGFDFEKIDKGRIIDLIEKELADFQEGSSEYIRLLCGYLYCLGDRTDIDLLKKVKYGINFDVGCMIDQEWIDSLENGGVRDERTRSREELVADFVQYYSGTASSQ